MTVPLYLVFLNAHSKTIIRYSLSMSRWNPRTFMVLDVSLYIIYFFKSFYFKKTDITTLSFDTVKENLPPDEK